MMLHELKQYKTDLDDTHEVWELLNKHCKDAIGTLPIVRGMNTFKKGFGIIHGEAGGRESRNTSNHYTVILDAVLPKDYPKRAKSIICANWKGRYHAKNYGTLHAILPFDGVKIGVCPEDDMFGTEVTLGNKTQAISRWNSFYYNQDITDSSYKALISDFKDVLKRKDLFGLDENTIAQTIAEAYVKPFKLATTKTAEIYNDGGPHELWIGGKCIAIELSLYRKVMREGTRQMQLKF